MTEENARLDSSEPRPGEFESELQEGRERFLAHIVEHGLSCGRRSPEDFIRHFPPGTIMDGLKDQPELRANIMVIATGTRAKVARKKSAEACAIDLQIALEEQETDAETIVTLFEPDDRVRFLDHSALWTYVTEGAFWESDPKKDPEQYAIAAKHVAYVIDRALRDQLLTYREVVDGISVHKIVQLLPRDDLERMLAASLNAGHAGKPFVERDLLGQAPLSILAKHIPLPWLWGQLVVPRIAEAHGFAPEVATSVETPAVTEGPSPEKESGSVAKVEPSVPEGADLNIGVDDVLSALGTDDAAPVAASDDKALSLPRPRRRTSKRPKARSHSTPPSS